MKFKPKSASYETEAVKLYDSASEQADIPEKKSDKRSNHHKKKTSSQRSYEVLKRDLGL